MKKGYISIAALLLALPMSAGAMSNQIAGSTQQEDLEKRFDAAQKQDEKAEIARTMFEQMPTITPKQAMKIFRYVYKDEWEKLLDKVGSGIELFDSANIDWRDPAFIETIRDSKFGLAGAAFQKVAADWMLKNMQKIKLEDAKKIFGYVYKNEDGISRLLDKVGSGIELFEAIDHINLYDHYWAGIRTDNYSTSYNLFGKLREGGIELFDSTPYWTKISTDDDEIVNSRASRFDRVLKGIQKNDDKRRAIIKAEVAKWMVDNMPKITIEEAKKIIQSIYFRQELKKFINKVDLGAEPFHNGIELLNMRGGDIEKTIVADGIVGKMSKITQEEAKTLIAYVSPDYVKGLLDKVGSSDGLFEAVEPGAVKAAIADWMLEKEKDANSNSAKSLLKYASRFDGILNKVNKEHFNEFCLNILKELNSEEGKKKVAEYVGSHIDRVHGISMVLAKDIINFIPENVMFKFLRKIEKQGDPEADYFNLLNEVKDKAKKRHVGEWTIERAQSISLKLAKSLVNHYQYTSSVEKMLGKLNAGADLVAAGFELLDSIEEKYNGVRCPLSDWIESKMQQATPDQARKLIAHITNDQQEDSLLKKVNPQGGTLEDVCDRILDSGDSGDLLLYLFDRMKKIQVRHIKSYIRSIDSFSAENYIDKILDKADLEGKTLDAVCQELLNYEDIFSPLADAEEVGLEDHFYAKVASWVVRKYVDQKIAPTKDLVQLIVRVRGCEAYYDEMEYYELKGLSDFLNLLPDSELSSAQGTVDGSVLQGIYDAAASENKRAVAAWAQSKYNFSVEEKK